METQSLNDFYAGGPTSFQEAFPPICITTHWDPTLVSRHVLPQQASAPLAEDPRQAVRICTSYYSLAREDKERTIPPAPLQFIAPHGGLASQSQPQEKLNIPATLFGPAIYQRPVENSGLTATPPGGAAGRGAPYEVYAESVGDEADLWRLNEPLTRCKERRYRPGPSVPTDSTNTLPHVSHELGLSPYATHIQTTTGCRAADDEAAWNRSGRLFFNHTRYDRVYPYSHGPLACGKTV